MGEGRSGNDKEDARKVGDNILKLVDDLGLKTTLTDLDVGRDQVPIIVRNATGLESGSLFEAVSEILNGLY